MRGVVAAFRLVCVAAFALAASLSATPAGAATPSPAPNPDITLSAQPMLNVVAPGAWVAIRVDVENHGPAVNGELRLAAADGQGSTYSVPVELATGARQEHFLYTQAGPFGARFDVSLRSGATVQATVRVSVEMPQNASRRVYVVAEHPERLTQPIGVALAAKGSPSPRIITIAPEDLPPRAEAWSSIDLLVWHDIDSARLGPERASALATWLMTGGNLVVFGGSMGTTMFGGFPAGLLPYQPEKVVDLAPTEVAENFGQLPAGAPAAPAVTGPLAGGTPLWTTSSGQVIGARKAEGQGGVALIGFDPTTEWFAGSEAAAALWLMAVPARASWDSTRLPADDGYLVSALGNLPSVQLPGGDLLLILIVAYIFTIGPINYAVLRRRDRREWAWLTMPLTIVAFGVAAYGLGVVMKGSNVIVSELAIVEAGVGAQRGEAEVHVGIFSPGRSDLDVHVGPQALVSSAGNQDGSGQGRPLDIVGGDPATLRNFGVNFGAMRTFRAQTSVDVPLLQADLRVAGGKLEGTVTNASGVALQDVAVIFAGNGSLVGDVAPGESKTVSVQPANGLDFEPLSWRLYSDSGTGDGSAARTIQARRAIIDHLDGGWDKGFGESGTGIFGQKPVILAWASGPALQVDTGSTVEQVGETAYVWPAPLSIAGPVVFQDALLGTTVESVDSADGFKEGSNFYLSRGTIAVGVRPIGFDGTFSVKRLGIRVGSEAVGPPAADGTDLAPLPAAEQPNSDAPLASNPRPGGGSEFAPRIQLFDLQSQEWVEFEPIVLAASFDIADPARYVGSSGAFRIRFVVRGGESINFGFGARVEGVIQ